MLKVLKLIHEGSTYFDPELFKTTNQIKKIPTNYIPKLTGREKEILKLIIAEYSSPDISKKLYISVGKVDTLRRNLISKLGVKNTAGLVRKAIEYQLVRKKKFLYNSVKESIQSQVPILLSKEI